MGDGANLTLTDINSDFHLCENRTQFDTASTANPHLSRESVIKLSVLVIPVLVNVIIVSVAVIQASAFVIQLPS